MKEEQIMEKIRRIYRLTAVVALLLLAVSCSDNNETPPPEKAFVPGEIVTVQQVRALYADQLAISDYTQRHPVEIVNDWALRGIITATDKEDGNFYKEAYIEDATGGLRLVFEATSGLYIGDSVIVNVKGLWLGDWISNPDITITQDNNSQVLSKEEVWIQYFRQSGTPQTALALGIEYNSSRFWWAGITGSYYDNIYLDFNPVTRTKDDTGYYPYWDYQQKADPGFLVDIFVGKSWRIDDVYVTLSANLSNVLDNRTVITGGYEQYRYDPERPDLFQPRVYYANGFNYFINLSIRY